MKSANLRRKCAREQMPANVPGMFAVWAFRSQSALDSQLNRKLKMHKLRQLENEDGSGTAANGKPPKKKREWWRLDPHEENKYKPIEPPPVPDPTILPTRDRIVFGWEAPLSPLEQVVQDEVRRHLPQLHEWIVRRAIRRIDPDSEDPVRAPEVPPVEDYDPDTQQQPPPPKQPSPSDSSPETRP